MEITREELVACIEKATREMDVHVPCRDYYARRGDSATETIQYISPQGLIEAINDLGGRPADVSGRDSPE